MHKHAAYKYKKQNLKTCYKNVCVSATIGKTKLVKWKIEHMMIKRNAYFMNTNIKE